jgi:plasmid stability protein
LALYAAKFVLHKGGYIEALMATLNVKNLPDGLYEKLKARAKRERRSVAQEVTLLLSRAVEAPETLSILDLKGLGRARWRGVDAADHVATERTSWD